MDFDDYIAAAKRSGFDTRSGDIFAFSDEELTRVGLLAYDGTGYQWCVKRLSRGNIGFWPDVRDKVSKASVFELNAFFNGNAPILTEHS
jgi:hypothetical protein